MLQDALLLAMPVECFGGCLLLAMPVDFKARSLMYFSGVAGKTDSHKSPEEGTSRNAKPGEFAPSDPKKPESNTPENSREKSGQ